MEGKKEEKIADATWTLRREEFEKTAIVLNHSTRPFIEHCFNPEVKRKVRVVMEYDPDNPCVIFNYYLGDKE